MIETIRANPIPAALAGASLYWLYRNRASDQGASYARQSRQAYPSRSTYEASWREGPAYDTRRTSSGAQGQGAVGAITDTVSGAASQAADVAGDVASSIASGAERAASSAGQMASTAGETAMDTGSDIVQLIRQNPIPAALVGLGLGWLYMNRSSGGPDYRAHSRDHYRYGPEAARQYPATGSYGSASSGSSSTGGVGDLARQAGSQVSDLAGQAGSQVSDLASGIQDQASDLAEAVVDRTTRAPGQIQRMINDNPLMTAALAASLGAAAGLMLPPTQTEDRLVGTTRDRMMGKAQQAASQAVDKVQSVADEVQHTASREAQAQGLTV